jgi:hypothetical protein
MSLTKGEREMSLSEYVSTFAVRGACTCGRCIDAGDAPETRQPNGHTADVYFFKVAAADGANREALLAAIEEHKGEFCECNPMDGSEHNYMELGGWVGDQGLALMLIDDTQKPTRPGQGTHGHDGGERFCVDPKKDASPSWSRSRINRWN